MDEKTNSCVELAMWLETAVNKNPVPVVVNLLEQALQLVKTKEE